VEIACLLGLMVSLVVLLPSASTAARSSVRNWALTVTPTKTRWRT